MCHLELRKKLEDLLNVYQKNECCGRIYRLAEVGIPLTSKF